MHVHYVEEDGELVDIVPFCSDSCHRTWCRENNERYGGWNGVQPGGYSSEWCASCGVITWAGDEACDCLKNNVVVGRFPRESGEKCEHGNWIQLPG